MSGDEDICSSNRDSVMSRQDVGQSLNGLRYSALQSTAGINLYCPCNLSLNVTNTILQICIPEVEKSINRFKDKSKYVLWLSNKTVI
jgi:hypothetical protein